MKKKRGFSRIALEQWRAQTLARVERKELTLQEAAHLLQLSCPQTQRLFRRFTTAGRAGLAHGLRGKASNRACDDATKQAIRNRYRERDPDFGPTLAAEKLGKEGYQVHPETLRLWLIAAGLWQSARQRPTHRSWRPRRAHFGELVQLDGSFHPWFEERGPESCLMNRVDDATGVTLALLAAAETTAAARTLLWKWIASFGIPAALYTDRKKVSVPTETTALQARLEGQERLTQFGRACHKLGIVIITAHSPQAKGRVERSNQTYQDRLVKALRLAGIKDIDAANELLYAGFLDELNAKFVVEAREAADFHRAAQPDDLAAIFCIEEERTLSRDWVVRFENDFYQLQRQSPYAPARGKV